MLLELPSSFLRVSRYSIINTDYLESINHSDQTIHLAQLNKYVGIGDTFKSKVMALLN